MESPYKFNDAALSRGLSNLGKQLHKHFKAQEKKPSPSSLQGRTDAYLDFAAANAKYKYAHIIEADKAAKAEAVSTAKAEAKAKADKIKRAADTRRATAAHKRRLAQQSELEDLRTKKQVERVSAVSQAKAAAKPPAAKAAPKTAAKRTASGVSTDKDGVLKPVVSKPKATKPKASPVLNTKAAEIYND